MAFALNFLVGWNRFLFVNLSLSLCCLVACQPAHRDPNTGKRGAALANKTKATENTKVKTSTNSSSDFPFIPIPRDHTEGAPDILEIRGVVNESTPELRYGSKVSCQRNQNIRNTSDVNMVALRQFVIMNQGNETEMNENPDISDGQLKDELSFQKLLGLKTILFLTATTNPKSVNSNKSNCPATSQSLQPIDLIGKSNLDKWFNSYGAFISKNVKMAAESGGVYAIGLGTGLTELSQTQKIVSTTQIDEFISTFQAHLKGNALDVKTQWTNFVQALFDFGGSNSNNNVDQELRSWAKQGVGQDENGRLTTAATQRLVYLENNRRIYLLGKWVQIISESRNLLSKYPTENRPLLTFESSLEELSKIEFWQFLDFVSLQLQVPAVDKTEVFVMSVGPILKLISNQPKVILSELSVNGIECQSGPSQEPLKIMRRLIQQRKINWLNGVLFWNALNPSESENSSHSGTPDNICK